MNGSSVNWRTGPLVLLAALLSLSLISCSTGKAPKVNMAVPSVLLPAPPAYLRPVTVADPKVGDDPLLVAASYRQGLKQCNARINSGVADWKGMQAFYATPVKIKG